MDQIQTTLIGVLRLVEHLFFLMCEHLAGTLKLLLINCLQSALLFVLRVLIKLV